MTKTGLIKYLFAKHGKVVANIICIKCFELMTFTVTLSMGPDR